MLIMRIIPPNMSHQSFSYIYIYMLTYFSQDTGEGML